ncbi:MAG TPA: L-threonylcarbamoyladenylate synthase [Thermoanaerobaculia bacterium]|nr:L-threonylcarbamoyladenylate synthase [Thermoanaerobaculia bacterium]
MSAALWRFGDPLEPLSECVSRGGILVIPTESSYGLGVDPGNAVAVERIFELKHRDGRKALPVVIANLAQLRNLGIDPGQSALRALAPLWPAPLTCALPLSRPCPAAAGGSSLAVRMPAHEPLRRLLEELGTALTATSANLAGEPPLLEPAEAAAWLAEEDAVVIDAGRLPGGPPSTLVAPAGDHFEVLRAGAFPPAQLPPIEVQP